MCNLVKCEIITELSLFQTQPDKTTQTDIDTAQETYVKKLSEPVYAPSFSSTEDDLRGYCSNININIGNITGKMSLSNVSGTQTGRELQPEQKFKSTGLCPVMSTEETTCKIANSPLKVGHLVQCVRVFIT